MSTVETVLGRFWIATGNHLWQTTIVVAVLVATARLVLRSAPGRVLHRFWWIVLAKLFLPLALLAPLAGEGAKAARFTETLRVFLDPFPPFAAASSGSSAWAPPVWSALTLLWATGGLWIFLGGRRRDASFRPGRNGPIVSAPREVRMRIEAALAGTKVPAERIRASTHDGMPAVMGFLQPLIVIPQRVALALDLQELRAVLLHEEGHRRRRDPLLGLVQRVALGAFFYYPPVWLILSRLRAAEEFSCDELAAGDASERQAYAASLAKILALGLTPAPGHAAVALSRPSLLRERFARIREPWRYTLMTRHRVALIAGAALLAASSFVPLGPVAGEGKALVVTADVVAPDLLEKIQPEYPEDARAARAGGKVILQAVIDTEGNVGSLEVLHSVEGYPSLTEAAMHAVRQWRYRPATRAGRPVPVSFTVVVAFSPEREIPELESVELRDRPVTLFLEDEPLSRILEALGRATGLQILLAGDFPDDLTTSVDWRDVPLKAALERLAAAHDLRYTVRDSRTLLVDRGK